VSQINNQIIMLEEMFESRKHLPIKRPNIKAQVLEQLGNAKATP
jgi:hypothetical protein